MGLAFPNEVLSRGLETLLRQHFKVTFSVDSITSTQAALSRESVECLAIHQDLVERRAVLSELVESAHGTRVVVMTNRYVHRTALEIVREGYVVIRETDKSDVILRAISGQIDDPLRMAGVEPPPPARGFLQLTRSELQILAFLAAGETDETISQLVFLSVHGVKKKIRNILQKTGARNRTEAAVRVVTAGLCPTPTSREVG